MVVVFAGLAQARRDFFEIIGAVPGWALFGLIMLAFLVFGLRDLIRLSWTRISAISSVCFQESIRRRVLWITPLAILGAVVVSQLQVAVDPQDAIRQTTKVCLFATGLVVALTAIILACTNLPKEIENRVIYTIVTKPTTRLEIVLGKVWGFAKVSAAILLIMGIFTFAYLNVRAWRLSRVIETAILALPESAPSRATLAHYKEAGLLNAKAMSQPAWMQVLAEAPVDGQPRLMAGGQGQKFGVAFKLTADDYPAVKAAFEQGGRMSLVYDIPVEVREPTAAELELIQATAIPLQPAEGGDGATTNPTTAPQLQPIGPTPTTGPAAPDDPAKPRLPQPTITIDVQNQSQDVIVRDEHLNGGKPIVLPTQAPWAVEVPVAPEALDEMFKEGDFVVLTEARSPAVRYAVGNSPVKLRVFNADDSTAVDFLSKTPEPRIMASPGRYGQQIIGGEEGKGGVAVFRFQGVTFDDPSGRGGGDALTFEVRSGIERAGDGTGETEALPNVQLRVRNVESGAVSEPVIFSPETNRISYIDVPREAFPAGGGRFDVLVRVLTPDQWLGMNPESVSLATGSRHFSFNLFKSLLILWLLSVLVVAIAVFCSTFLSWPIAVVLTLVLLLGHWGVEQIKDVSGGGLALGAQFTSRTEDVAQSTVIRESVDALGRLLEVVAAFLPDVSQFQATADIERGISMPVERLRDAGWVLLGYGVPIVVLAYLILKRKEVAP